MKTIVEVCRLKWATIGEADIQSVKAKICMWKPVSRQRMQNAIAEVKKQALMLWQVGADILALQAYI